MIEKIFFNTKVKVTCEGKSIILFAQVSPYGAARVVKESEINSALLAMLGKEVEVQINNQAKAKGIFVREVASDGIYLNIRFNRISEEDRNLIRSWINEKGDKPDWKRKYPRIPVSDSHPELPGPFLAMVSFHDQTYAMSVKDYTFWGIKLEFISTQPTKIALGSKVTIDLMNHLHEEIKGIEGDVKHVMENKLADSHGMSLSYGIEFSHLPPDAEHSFRDMILKYCLTLKGLFQAEITK
jgi:hypothetical protein